MFGSKKRWLTLLISTVMSFPPTSRWARPYPVMLLSNRLHSHPAAPDRDNSFVSFILSTLSRRVNRFLDFGRGPAANFARPAARPARGRFDMCAGAAEQALRQGPGCELHSARRVRPAARALPRQKSERTAGRARRSRQYTGRPPFKIRPEGVCAKRADTAYAESGTRPGCKTGRASFCHTDKAEGDVFVFYCGGPALSCKRQSL